MKIYAAAPKDEVIIVKDGDEYTWYHVTVKVLTSGHKLGNMRYDVEGHRFSNLNTATDYVCDQRGLTKFVGDRRGNDRPRVQGLDMVQSGTWHKFCELRRISPKDVVAMQREYSLTDKEREALGLDENRNL